ncbi:MAG: hypothetical protein A2420_00200 [Candidatus Moranbacteria bacterium RIFOXYC1_FULL_44_13]|nr:MAG: hypothetical protein A2184_03180 [Candidatus Moranbacteria bacterium RIFOXYA1_FULL_44_7]OGI33533.1 MAG: hypothetical protein A2420_00200 [Candidatus Moranbacteria bacterium RIFOXYC1_FULL_44_13]OGI38262.1 MAG: hypothetical protein A2612_01715 [Candidatus Moranbacteria bacterium RIFOXYD1_FULL_44_12]
MLERLEIPYVVTGGVAVTVWGRPRFTADIDIAIEVSLFQSKELFRFLRKIDKRVYISEAAMNRAVSRKSEFNLIHPDGVKVDFWVLEDDIYARSRMKRKKIKRVWGQNISFISPEDLILSKLVWYKRGRSTRQLEDIESIIAIQKKMDWKYIKRWAAIQSTEKFLKLVLKK